MTVPLFQDPAALMRALFDRSSDSVAMSEGLLICYANQACADLFGYPTTEAMTGVSALELIAPAAREQIIDHGRRREAGTRGPARYVTRGQRLDGREFVLEIRGLATVFDDAHMVVVHRDLSTEEIVAAGPPPVLSPGPDGSLYRAMFEVNSAIKLLIDPDTGYIVDANRAALTFYGWSLDTMRGMRISEINTLTVEELRTEMHAAVSGRRGYFCFRHRVASGELRHVEVHSGPIELGARQLLMSIIHDVTARDALEQHLRMSQRLEAVGRLAGGVAHEFNNLLTVTLTASDALLRKLEPTSPHRRYLEDIAFASERAAVLTRELLAFSKRQFLQPRALDLNQVVAELGGVLQRTFGDAAVLTFALADALPPASVDPTQLEQVVMNLVINARDASPRGSEILVTTTVEDVGRMSTISVPPGRWIVLRVRDSGHGMDESTRLRMFEPMFTTKPTGHGLGMATVYGIVTQGGGHLTVDSTPGAGTEIAVYLPPAPDGAVVDTPRARESSPAVVSVAARVDVGDARVRRVLVVDDLDQVRTAVASCLREMGYDVREASSADAALALLDSTADAVDVVVSDIQMPGRSGIELAVELFVRKPTLPVLLISGDLRGHDASGLAATTRLLHKPFSMQQLGAVLDDMFAAP